MEKFPLMVYGSSVNVHQVANDEDELKDLKKAGYKEAKDFFNPKPEKAAKVEEFETKQEANPASKEV